MSTQYPVLNDRVTPNILCIPKVSTDTAKWSTNLFADPIDAVPFEEAGLTAVEKGHVYKYDYYKAGDRIYIRMPYKLMDKETGELLKGLVSFRVEGQHILSSERINSRLYKNPKIALREFSLGIADFGKFKKRVDAIKGLVELDTVDIKELSREIEGYLQELSNGVAFYNNFVTALRGLMPAEKMVVELAILDKFEARIVEIRKSMKEISKAIERLHRDGMEQEATIAMALQDALMAAMSAASDINFRRTHREVNHAIRKQTLKVRKESVEPVQYKVRSLKEEIDELACEYPVLKRLLVLSDTDIRITSTVAEIGVPTDTKKVVTLYRPEIA